MPGNVTPAAPVDVMPEGLCSEFVEELRIEGFANKYVDGSSDRAALVQNARHFFRFTRKAEGADYSALWTFVQAHLVKEFWFYHLRETAPPFTWDATGQNTAGRYAVVLDGNWSDQYNLGRSGISLGLREVA
jgi:hypothetical protein